MTRRMVEQTTRIGRVSYGAKSLPRWLPVACAIALSAGCRGEPTVPPHATKTWPAMTGDERMAHMTAVVEPRMRTLFQGFDRERFADFGCRTCHGQGVDDGTFAMPNPLLPKLDPTFFYRKHRKQNPAIADFMWKTVEPETAKLLGLPRGDEGIDCGSCHLLED